MITVQVRVLYYHLSYHFQIWSERRSWFDWLIDSISAALALTVLMLFNQVINFKLPLTTGFVSTRMIWRTDVQSCPRVAKWLWGGGRGAHLAGINAWDCLGHVVDCENTLQSRHGERGASELGLNSSIPVGSLEKRGRCLSICKDGNYSLAGQNQSSQQWVSWWTPCCILKFNKFKNRSELNSLVRAGLEHICRESCERPFEHKPVKMLKSNLGAGHNIFLSDFNKRHTTVNKHTNNWHPVLLHHDPKINKHEIWLRW